MNRTRYRIKTWVTVGAERSHQLSHGSSPAVSTHDFDQRFGWLARVVIKLR